MALGSLWARIRRAAAQGSAASVFMSSRSEFGSGFLRQFNWRLFGLATWLPVAVWFNSAVVEVTRIEGPSMHPFLNSHFGESLERDWVLNCKLYAQEGLQRGMIVFLRSPVHPEVVSVKRVIGLEGDVVQTRRPYPTAYVRVPAGHVWVEGDAGEGRSLDSNTYGPVSIGLVTGRLSHILLPLNKAGLVRWWEHPLEDRITATS
ncbi:mitochondrial inner membrane protease subunit [Grosmannia clavigera kw1407]|uniref:Mitochondrial inner membrane protease subunit 2 n=1 Tax=Grosmannia clavigera (strain kw1407 / UAMH 11150) TaxID=655863 RepID=F0XHX6_GROCL|nr:mitochondrial inner membrane protease subunit [Grosmannia clavigera kw1407]EFX02699.1 mitochondrial inner membrane protease subunit [Grosmannia clavigera kw1407]